MSERLVNLKFDHTASKVGKSLGINEKRKDEIHDEMEYMARQIKASSGVLELITKRYTDPYELVYAIFAFGRFHAQSECPLHQRTGGMQALVAMIERKPKTDEHDNKAAG